MFQDIPIRLWARHLWLYLSTAAAFLLSACGPEAPPCNDAQVTKSMLQLVTQAHDDNLKTQGYKVADLATITLDTPEVTAYDEKLKTRSCKVTYTVQLPNDRAPQMARYMAAMENPLMSIAGAIGGLAAAFGGPDPRKELAQQQADVVAFQLWNQGPLTGDPVRKSVSYRIQKEEGGKDYVVRTSVDVNGSIQYLRIAAQTDMQLKREAEQDKAQAAKQAQTDRLSASGTWRKAVVIQDFATGHNDPYYCSKNKLYCMRARDAQGGSATEAFYEIDEQKVDQNGANALLASQRGGQAVCLIGVQKTQDPNIFKAKGYSTSRNDKGEPLNCQPGAEGQDAKVAAGAPTGTASPAVAGSASSPSGPENLMSLVTHYEPCGSEAMCLYTARGNTVWMNANALTAREYAVLDEGVKSKQPVCLKQVERTQGRDFSAETVAKQC